MNRVQLSNVKLRRKAWIGNALRSIPLRLTRLFRDKTIWLFGAWEGERFDDNSRYLYDYVVTNYPQITPYWVTRNENVYHSLLEMGVNVLFESTDIAQHTMKKAGVVIYTHGLDDFGYKCSLYGAYLINITHAISGIKKDYYLDEQRKSNRPKFLMHKVMDILFDWYRFDCCTVSSKAALEWRMAVHNRFDKTKYVITGLPRNDVLRGKSTIKLSRPNWMAQSKKYITFLPTYRPYGNDVVKRFVDELQADADFISALQRNNAEILIKLHPVDKTSKEVVISTVRIHLLGQEDVESTQVLQYFSSVLITDYSSACMDYSLTRRPVILYAPDYELYDEIHGIVDFWHRLYDSDSVLKDITRLKQSIIASLEHEEECMEITNLLINMYEDETIRDTIYSQNVMNAIFKLIHMEG